MNVFNIYGCIFIIFLILLFNSFVIFSKFNFLFSDNDELITSNESNVSSKHATCDENKDSVDSQMSIVDFPTELLVGERGQSAESLEVKNNKSSNATNFEQLKLDNKNEVDNKTKSEIKSDTESKKSNDDIIIGVEEKMNCKYVADEKKSQVRSDDDDGKIGDEEEEKKIGTGTSCMYFNKMCIGIIFPFSSVCKKL